MDSPPLPSGAAPTLSLVVPVFNEAGNLPAFVERATRALEALGEAWEMVCVDDGSTDASLVTLLAARARDPRIIVIQLSRNFGKEIALTAGLDHARGAAVIPIDADLQHPPEVIGAMVAQWRAGFDMVVAVRENFRQEGLVRRAASALFDRLFRRLSKVELPAGAGDFRLLSAPVVAALRELPERSRFMKGLYAWVGFRHATVPYTVEARVQGRSAHGFGRLWRLAVDAITAFSALPLKFWSGLGLVIALVAFAYGTYLVVQTLVRGIALPGYASTITLILFLGGLQLLSLGVLGEYVARIYEEVKGRPLYIVRARHGCATPPP